MRLERKKTHFGVVDVVQMNHTDWASWFCHYYEINDIISLHSIKRVMMSELCRNIYSENEKKNFDKGLF